MKARGGHLLDVQRQRQEGKKGINARGLCRGKATGDCELQGGSSAKQHEAGVPGREQIVYGIKGERWGEVRRKTKNWGKTYARGKKNGGITERMKRIRGSDKIYLAKDELLSFLIGMRAEQRPGGEKGPREIP